MKATKFIESYKCECFQPHNTCNCPGRAKSAELFIEQINCVARALIKVMSLCGIPRMNAATATNVIVYHFLHYNEFRERMDAIPRKRFNRSTFMHDLGRRCLMNRVQSEIVYLICKRAFKAFYYGTGEGGVPNPSLRAQLKHSPQCLWHYAAYRTAQTYASLMDLFPICQKALEVRIRDIYRTLYARLKSEQLCFDDHECDCRECTKRLASIRLQPAHSALLLVEKMDRFQAIYQKEVTAIEESPEYKQMPFPEIPCQDIKRCNCPRLKFHKGDNEILQLAEIINTGYGQGSFECFWYAVSKEDDIDDNKGPEINLPECPPCILEEESCDNICECDCESCVCESEKSKIEQQSEETEESQEDANEEQTEQLELGHNTSIKDKSDNLSKIPSSDSSDDNSACS